MSVSIECLYGQAITPYLEQVAQLRINVFSAYPYLYQGDMEYEQNYLTTYADCERSLFVIAKQDEKVVGASTCQPMLDAHNEFKTPFIGAGFDIKNIMYFGESVLLPELRGQRIGLHFMQERQAYAERLGLSLCTFCAVDRGDNHPLKPANYQPLDRFWNKFGFRKNNQLSATFRWQDIDQMQETEKTLYFWLKEINKTNDSPH